MDFYIKHRLKGDGQYGNKDFACGMRSRRKSSEIILQKRLKLLSRPTSRCYRNGNGAAGLGPTPSGKSGGSLLEGIL
jgi:hypothetical protein